MLAVPFGGPPRCRGPFRRPLRPRTVRLASRSIAPASNLNHGGLFTCSDAESANGEPSSQAAPELRGGAPVNEGGTDFVGPRGR